MNNVLFVCVENSCRSQIAEAFAKIHGSNMLCAYSAGSKASGTVNDKAIISMQEKHYDLSAHRSNSLLEIPDINYDYAITMGCGDECPSIRANRREDWAIDDPKHMNSENFNEIRDLIENKVVSLIRGLENK